ncbi:DNA double-strand break repair nuclease NurA [Candidatus Woesearchaeota archaeon]|nr:DNA double-strand break repair nuclease NurA [Candidatus Woesearchaeota archaeon]
MIKQEFFEALKELKNDTVEHNEDITFKELPNPQKYSYCTIDGGSSEIFMSASAGVFIVRIYARHKKRERSEELAVALQDKNDKNKIIIKGQKTRINITINQQITGDFVNSCTQAIGNYRKLRELTKALDIAKREKVEIIILDGNLETRTREESKIMEELVKECARKETTIIGFCKSTTQTINNKPLTKIMNEKATLQKWFAKHKSSYIVKLHKQAKTPYKIEIIGNEEKALSFLHWNARDIATPGYPYTLIDADRHAQVSQKEKTRLKVLFHAYSKNKLKIDEEGVKYHETINRF